MANNIYKFPWQQPPGGLDLNANIRGMTLNLALPTVPLEDSPIDLSFRKEPEKESNSNGVSEMDSIIVDGADVTIKVEKDDETSGSPNRNEVGIIQTGKANKVPLGPQIASSMKSTTNKPKSKGGRVEPIIEMLKERSNKKLVVPVNSDKRGPMPDSLIAQNIMQRPPALTPEAPQLQTVPLLPVLLITNRNFVQVLDPSLNVFPIKTEPADGPVLPSGVALDHQGGQTIIGELITSGPELNNLSQSKKTSSSSELASASYSVAGGRQVNLGESEESYGAYENVINITPQKRNASGKKGKERKPRRRENPNASKRMVSSTNSGNTDFQEQSVINLSNSGGTSRQGKTKRRVPPEYRRRTSFGKKKKKNVKVVVIGAGECGGGEVNDARVENVATTAVGKTNENTVVEITPVTLNDLQNEPSKTRVKNMKKKRASKSESNVINPAESSLTAAKKKQVTKSKRNNSKVESEVTKKVRGHKKQKKDQAETSPSLSSPSPNMTLSGDCAPTIAVVCDPEIELQKRYLVSSSLKTMLPIAKQNAKLESEELARLSKKAQKKMPRKVQKKKEVIKKKRKRCAAKKVDMQSELGEKEEDEDDLPSAKKAKKQDYSKEYLPEKRGCNPVSNEGHGLESKEGHGLESNEGHGLESSEGHELEEEEGEEEPSYNCNNCHEDFVSLDEIQNHTCSTPPKQLSCLICNDKFESKEHLIVHLEVHFLKKFDCKYCGKSYKNLANCRKHESNHQDGTRFLCKICSLAFDSDAACVQHERVHVIKKLTFPCSCPICSKILPNAASYARHERIHWPVKPHKCKFCDRRFTEKQNCATHERRHENLRPFQCDHCPAKFYSQGEKIVHQKIHSGEKHYQCLTCKKRFRTDSILRSHLLVHLNLRPFKCDYCNKGFKRKRDCEIHVRGHFGIKPYACEICKKTFTSRGNLNQHLRLHESLESSSLQCKFCDRHFRWHHSLSIHEEWHKKFQCCICSTQCTSKRTLKMHEQGHLLEAGGYDGPPSKSDLKSYPKRPRSKRGENKVDKGKTEEAKKDDAALLRPTEETPCIESASDEDDVPLTKFINSNRDENELERGQEPNENVDHALEEENEMSHMEGYVENTLSLADI